jgi:hypothetical protein
VSAAVFCGTGDVRADALVAEFNLVLRELARSETVK